MLNQIKNKQNKTKKTHTHTHTKEKLHPGAELWFTWKFRRWIIAELGPQRILSQSVLSEHFSLTESGVNLSAAGSRSPSALEGGRVCRDFMIFGSTRFPNTKASPYDDLCEATAVAAAAASSPCVKLCPGGWIWGWRRHDQKEGGRWSEGGENPHLTPVLSFPCLSSILNSLQ